MRRVWRACFALDMMLCFLSTSTEKKLTLHVSISHLHFNKIFLDSHRWYMSDFFGKNHLDFHEILPVNLLNHMSSSSGQSFHYARIIFHDSFWAYSCRQKTNLAVTRWALPWNLFFFFSVLILKVCRLQNTCTFLCVSVSWCLSVCVPSKTAHQHCGEPATDEPAPYGHSFELLQDGAHQTPDPWPQSLPRHRRLHLHGLQNRGNAAYPFCSVLFLVIRKRLEFKTIYRIQASWDSQLIFSFCLLNLQMKTEVYFAVPLGNLCLAQSVCYTVLIDKQAAHGSILHPTYIQYKDEVHFRLIKLPPQMAIPDAVGKMIVLGG